MIPGPHPQVALTPAQIQAQQAAQIQANDRARLRSRKPIDKNLPEGVDDIIIGDGAQRYRDLRDVERRLDSIITRKRLDIQDSVNRNVKVNIFTNVIWREALAKILVSVIENFVSG